MESITFLISSLFLLLCINQLFHFTINLYRRRNLPPGPTGFPIIGNLLKIGDKPFKSFSDLAKAHGPLMTVKLGFTTAVVASSAEMAREILQKHDQAFLGRQIPDAVTAETDYRLSIAWVSAGPLWRDLRKLCKTQIFTVQRLDALQSVRHKAVKDMIHILADASEDGESVNIGKLVFAGALNMISNTIFSVDIMDSKSSEVEELKGLIWRAMDLEGKPNVSDFFPVLKWFDLQGIKREVKVVYDRMHKVIDGIIERRLERRAFGLPRCDDLLDILIDNIQNCSFEHLTRRSMQVLLTHLFMGGTDTTTTTVEWAMAELIKNPEIMAKAKEELSETLGQGNHIEESHIRKLPYLEAIIKETMRLHPTAPLLLPHRAEEEVKIGNYTIPKHTQVFVNAWSVARDPSNWEDPTSFVPERFVGTGYDFNGRNFSFLPFGSGRRICPAVDFGVRMMTLLLGSMIHHFDWKLPNGMTPEEIDMSEKVGITLQMATPLVALPLSGSPMVTIST